MAMTKRHTDVVSSMDEFTSNYEKGLYLAPWIVYVGNDTDGYSVIYSNDEQKGLDAKPEFIESLSKRIEALENEKVFCFEEEYDALVANGSGWVTNVDGTRSEVVFDANKLYYIYEDNGPEVSPEEPTPDEPVEPTPDEPVHIEFVGDILLEGDYEPAEPIILSNVVTNVNLNNKTITAPVFAESNGQVLEGNSDSYAFWVKEGAELTIEGEGKIESQEAAYSMAVWAQGGKVTIKGGEYYNHGDGCDLIYASAGGHVDIYGGEFHATEYRGVEAGTGNKHSALNIKNSDRAISDIKVYGGKFYGFDPANNVSEPNPSEEWLATHPNGFVAEGYESIEVEPDVWEVRQIENN